MNSKQDNRQGLVHLPNLISGALQKPSHEDSQQLLPAKLKDNGYAEVSIFGGEMASPSDVLVAVNKLSTAFPKQSQSFWELLALRIGEKGMRTKIVSAIICACFITMIALCSAWCWVKERVRR